jgi:hypothetical protein
LQIHHFLPISCSSSSKIDWFVWRQNYLFVFIFLFDIFYSWINIFTNIFLWYFSTQFCIFFRLVDFSRISFTFRQLFSIRWCFGKYKLVDFLVNKTEKLFRMIFWSCRTICQIFLPSWRFSHHFLSQFADNIS